MRTRNTASSPHTLHNVTTANCEFYTLEATIKEETMSDLPALQLFEEIQGLSNSMDFYSYTKEDLSRTWSLYDDDGSMETRAAADKTNTSTFSGKSSPTRDTWDPMLYNINLTTYVELSLEDEVQVRKQPVLETPMTPVSLPGVEELQMFVMSQQQQQQSQLATEQARARHHFTDRDLSGSLQQKVK